MDEKNLAVRIYVMAHKPFTPPPDPLYVPLQVGRAAANPLPFAGDDTGDEISAKNCYYSELTGLYWVWKNVRADYVGVCHYRRYLLNEDGVLFTAPQIVRILKKYDVITTKNLQLNFPYREGFAAHHKPLYLEETARILQERYPGYYRTFSQLVEEKHTYFGNMLIAARETYDAYMEWLFSVLFELEGRVKVEEEDSYHRRIFGFLSEFLQYVWIRHNELSAYECMVGMTGEKAEIAQVRRELAGYFSRADIDGAKQCFLKAQKARPDLLMEASDVTGELHLCMEVIAIAGLEQQTYGKNILLTIRDHRELMRYCSGLNRFVTQKLLKKTDPESIRWRKEHEVTQVAEHVAEAMMKSRMHKE